MSLFHLLLKIFEDKTTFLGRWTLVQSRIMGVWKSDLRSKTPATATSKRDDRQQPPMRPEFRRVKSHVIKNSPNTATMFDHCRVCMWTLKWSLLSNDFLVTFRNIFMDWVAMKRNFQRMIWCYNAFCEQRWNIESHLLINPGSQIPHGATYQHLSQLFSTSAFTNKGTSQLVGKKL